MSNKLIDIRQANFERIRESRELFDAYVAEQMRGARLLAYLKADDTLAQLVDKLEVAAAAVKASGIPDHCNTVMSELEGVKSSIQLVRVLHQQEADRE